MESSSSTANEKNYEVLYKYSSVLDWNKRFETEAARRDYLPQLLWFTKDIEITTDEFLALPSKEVRDKVWEYVKRFRSTPRKAANIRVALANLYHSRATYTKRWGRG